MYILALEMYKSLLFKKVQSQWQLLYLFSESEPASVFEGGAKRMLFADSQSIPYKGIMQICYICWLELRLIV